MEKKYVKPDVYVERFELSQAVALSCGWTSDSTLGSPTHADIDVCGWNMEDGLVVFVSNPTCAILMSPETTINGGCYNNHTTGQAIFAS